MISNFNSFLNEALFRKVGKKKNPNTKEDLVKSCGYGSVKEFQDDVVFLNKHKDVLQIGNFTNVCNVANIKNVRHMKDTYGPYIEDLDSIRLNLSEISDSGYRLKIILQNLGSFDGGTWFGFLVQIQSKVEVNQNQYNYYQQWFKTEEIIDIMECLQVAEGRLEAKFSGISINQNFINTYIIPEDFAEHQANQNRNGGNQNACPVCQGDGEIVCGECNGEGYTEDEDDEDGRECGNCQGSGYLQCNNCHGDGHI